jgi:hypothetical protein
MRQWNGLAMIGVDPGDTQEDYRDLTMLGSNELLRLYL